MAAEVAVLGDYYSTILIIGEWLIDCHSTLERKDNLLTDLHHLFEQVKDRSLAQKETCDGLLACLPDIKNVYDKAVADGRIVISEKVTASLAQIKAETEDALLFFVAVAQAAVTDGTAEPGYDVQAVRRIASVQSSEPQFRSTLLRVLMRSYNLFNGHPDRFQVLDIVVGCALDLEMPESLFAYCSRILQWLQEAPVKQRSIVCTKLLQVLEQKPDSDHERYALLKVMVADFDEMKTPGSPAVLQVCAKLAVLALRLADVVLYDSFVASPSMKHLEKSEAHSTTLWPLLRIFHEGSMQAFDKLPRDIFAQWGLEQAELRRKLAMVVICSMAAGGDRAIPISGIAQTLGVSEEDAESIAARAVSNELIAGHVDQLENVLMVANGLQRSFTRAHWQQLLARVTALTTTIDHVLSSLLNENAA